MNEADVGQLVTELRAVMEECRRRELPTRTGISPLYNDWADELLITDAAYVSMGNTVLGFAGGRAIRPNFAGPTASDLRHMLRDLTPERATDRIYASEAERYLDRLQRIHESLWRLADFVPPALRPRVRKHHRGDRPALTTAG